MTKVSDAERARKELAQTLATYMMPVKRIPYAVDAIMPLRDRPTEGGVEKVAAIAKAYIDWVAMTAKFKGDDGRYAARLARELKETLASLQAGEAAPVVEGQTFFEAVKQYSYPAGREITVRVHESGWDVYDPDGPATPAQPVQTAQGVAEGWKLVPIEPTQAMIEASGVADMNTWGSISSMYRAMWYAMLSTAPQPSIRDQRSTTDEKGERA